MPEETPLETKLRTLNAKLKETMAKPAAVFSNGVEDGEGRKQESIERTRRFIAQVEAEIKAQGKPAKLEK